MNAPLPPALDSERIALDGPGGGLNLYASGSGAPLLLIHSINAAASAAEVRPLFEHYRQSRRVFALDLPGFGFSERSDRPYMPRLMSDAVKQATAAIRARVGPAPIDALAVSLSCEFLARAASEAPEHYRSLALVSPTGFRGTTQWRKAPGTTRGQAWLYRALRGPGWGEALYRGLTRPGVIRYFLRRTWGSPGIDEALWRYDILTARVPGAQHAPLYFLSAYLFSADISDVYEAIRCRVWASHGVRGDFTDYRGMESMRSPSRDWSITTFQTGALPYFELPDEFLAHYDEFLEKP
jgi:pimeloyl-ACP methyl ester carboxylesterase